MKVYPNDALQRLNEASEYYAAHRYSVVESEDLQEVLKYLKNQEYLDLVKAGIITVNEAKEALQSTSL